MAGILPKRHSMESDDGSDPELSDVFIGPITKEEIRAHMKTKKKNVSVTKYPKAPVGTPRVIDHINLVTPVKGSGRNGPLDLSMRKTTPMVVDISTPTVSQTITLPDTPRYTSILNESDFMDESDIGISVDSVIVDLSRDIEAEMENDLKEIEKNRALSNQSLHLQSFFNNATHLNITNTDASSVQTRKDNLDTTMNDTHGNFNNTQTMNDIHQMDCSQKTSNSMNQEQNASGMHLNLTENNHSTITRNTEILNASNTLKDNKSQILNNTSHNRSTSLTHSVSYVHNESSQLASEVSSVWSGGEEQSFGKESDDSKNQDVLSESFQYYPGRATDKENDLNQGNQVPSILIKYEDESHLNETFEKLSMRHSKSGSDPNAPPNAAEDTLEEIDILEKYGYKTAHTDNIIIPTINILSATIIEESFDEKEADHNTSEALMDVSSIPCKENIDQDPLEHSGAEYGQNIELDPLRESFDRSEQNMDHSLNKSEQNMDHSLNKSKQNMDHSLNKSKQNMDHSLDKSRENMGHSLNKSKQNMDNSLNKSEQNMDHSLNKSIENMGHSLTKTKQNMDHSLNKSKQNLNDSVIKSKHNMDNSLNKSKQNMDHSLNKSEQRTNHSLNKSKQNMDHSLNKSKQNMDHSLNKSERNMDHSLNKSKENMHNSLNKSKHNMDHSLNKSEQNMDHSLNKSKQNMDHSLNKSKHNMDHSLNKSEQIMDHSLNKSKHNMDHSLNKSEQNMDHSLNKSKHNMVHSLNKSKQNLNHSLNKSKQNMDHSLNKSKQNTDQSLNKSRHVIDKDTLEVSLNNPAINADVLQPSSSENSECLPEIKNTANKSSCEPEDKSVPSMCAAPSADSLSSSVRPTEEIEQNDTNIHEVSQMLADTSIQTKKNVTMETSTLNKSCVHIMSRDSCVGLYETVNEVGASGLLSACPELEEEDDLDHSIIDNSDATNYWKEVNSANNTAYIELSPIKKNASTEITVEGVQSDHTYAHGEACSIQSNFADASSSVQVVQYIYANTSKELLKSIVEENEPHKDESNEIEMVLTENEKDVKVPADVSMTQTEGNRNVSRKENKDISHSASSEQVVQFVGDLRDVSMKTEDVISVSGNSSTFQAEVSDPLNKTFDEGDVDLVAEIDANVEPSDNEKRTSQTPSAGERNEPDESKEDVSVKIEKQMKEENINVVTNDRRAAEVLTKNEMENFIAVQSAVSDEQDVANVKDGTGLIIDVSGLKESMMNGVSVVQEEDKSEINNASMKQLEAQIEKKNESVNNNTAQDTFEHKISALDECDFRSLAEKYGGDNTGVSLCTTTELSSFNQEIFMKPRQLDDNLNVSSPDLESSKRDLKKAASKPISQIPMSKRPNVLRPTKFSNDNIKMSSKPVLKVKSAENSMIKPMNGSTHKVQKENVPSPKVKNTSAVHKENVSSPRVKATLATPLTPARSISQSLVSTISSFANKITGRTPRKESNNPAKLKSPEHTSCLKSPKPTSGVAHSSKFTPMLAKFKTQPSSTPAVKSTASNAPTPRHKSSNTPTPRHKTPHEATVRKSLSTSKLEGQHKTPNKLNLSGSRKLDFKNVESKIGSIRKPSELPLLQKVVKSPKPSLIKPPKFTGSKLPSMITAAGPVKRTSKFLNVMSPIGAYIRDGTKATSDNKKDGSFIPRKLMRLNQSETPQSGKLVATENTFGNGGNSTVSADVSMGESCVLVNQEINASNVMKHTAL